MPLGCSVSQTIQGHLLGERGSGSVQSAERFQRVSDWMLAAGRNKDLTGFKHKPVFKLCVPWEITIPHSV